VMVVAVSDRETLPAPETICSPTGAAWAMLAESSRAVVMSLLFDPLL